ncbi:MAG: ABC transporter permease subunit, partial [Treponema sp.]|nr:ABC transporter permease subunit [Treponema sp.]
MFKKKLIKLIAVSALFAIGDWWIFSSLIHSFRSYSESNSLKEVSLFAKTAPDNADYYGAWLDSMGETIEGSKALVLGVDQDFNFHPLTGDEDVQSFWDEQHESEVFTQALESVYYMVPYTQTHTVRLGDNPMPMRVFFLPIPDDSGYDLRGAVIILVPSGAGGSFQRLLVSLGILAWVLFTLIFAIGAFSRDPITGYSVLFLFALSAAFIAYPLLEALRLSFVEEGVFSLEIWKRTLSPEFLIPLWGSIKLGMVTATVSTLIGFAFAFLTERTGAGHKKLIGTLATMPVISPPFSLTLSIILLFGNNGLITRQLLRMENFSIYGLGGLVLVQTIGMFPIAYMTLSSVLRSIDSTVEDAALDLRATRLKTFLTITLPLSLPGLLSAWLLVFTNSLADFANPLLLAGSYRVLSVAAYIQVTGRSDLGGGAALSLLLLLPTLTAFFAQRYWVNRKSYVTVTGKPSTRLAELATKPVRIALTSFVWICLGFTIALYGTIVAGCFVRNWG